MKRIIVPAEKDQLDTVRDFITDELEANDCPPVLVMRAELCVEEIFINIASYAYAPGSGDAEVSVDVSGEPQTMTLVFSDRGVPFDPLSREEADTSPDALMSREGGLGILMVRKMMDDVTYLYEDGCNRLTLKKIIG